MFAPTVTGTVYTASSGSTPVLSLSTTTTVASGLVGGMLICIVTNPFGNQPATATWLGTPMNSIGFGAGVTFKQIFWLKNPAPGTGSLTVNWNVFSHDILMANFVVQNGGRIDASIDNGGFPNGSSASQAITTTKDNELLISLIWTDASVTHTQGTGQTQLSNQTFSTWRMSTSSKAAATAGSQSMAATFSGAADWDMAVIAIGIPPKTQGDMFLVL